jgi:nucleotide-binding universal stress UspA family protein
VLRVTRLRDHSEGWTGLVSEPTSARPVVLATTAVRVHPEAERIAIEAALEAGVPLVLVNLVPLPLFAQTLILVGPSGTTFPHEEALDDVRATARRAAELGVKTELLRVRTRHAATALLEVVRERDAGLLVFGPKLGPFGRWRFRRAVRRIRREADCLVWIAPDG